MKIGVCMPSYNQARWLDGALGSYYVQTHKDSQLVVVDDGSTDATPALLKEHYREPWVIRHPRNKGSAEAINTGIAALTAIHEIDALSWISSDNKMDPSWLALLVDAMQKNGAGAVYGGFWYVRVGGHRTYMYRRYDKDRLLGDLNCFFGPAFLIRRDVWLEAGPHRGKISHDYDHWLRVEETCWRMKVPIIGVDKALCDYNAHDERVTVTRANDYDAHIWQLEAKKRRSGL